MTLSTNSPAPASAIPARPGLGLALLAAGVLILAAILWAAQVGVPAGDTFSFGRSILSAFLLAAALLGSSAASAWIGGQLLRHPWLGVGLPVWAASVGVAASWLAQLAGVGTENQAPGWEAVTEAIGAWGSAVLVLMLACAIASAFYTAPLRSAMRCVPLLFLIGAPWLALALLAPSGSGSSLARAMPRVLVLVFAAGASGAAFGHAFRVPSARRLAAAAALLVLGLAAGWFLTGEAAGNGAGGPDSVAGFSSGTLGPIQAGSTLIVAWAQWCVLLALGYQVQAQRPQKADAALAGKRPSPDRPGLGSLPGRAYLWLALAFAAFVLYGSLVPLDFRSVPQDDAWAEFWRLWPWPADISRSDFAANVLLGVPLGFLGMGFLTRENARRRRWPAAVALLVLCCLFSACVEFSQLYVPERTTSFSDIAAQIGGAAIGIALWFIAGAHVTCYVRSLWSEYLQDEKALKVLGGYAVAYAIYQMLPFDIATSPADLYHKLKTAHVNLIPFGAPGDLGLYSVISRTAVILPIGYAIVLLARGKHLSLAAAAVVGAAYAAALEFAQLFVMSRYSSTTDIVLGLAGGALGGWLALHFGPAARCGLTGTLFWVRHGTAVKRLMALAGLAGLLGLAWHSLAFRWPEDGLVQHLRTAVCVPLATYYYQSEIGAAGEVAREFLAFLALGLLLRSVMAPSARGSRAAAWAIGAAVATTVVLETGLLLLPDRMVDPASGITQVAGGVLGVLLYPRFVDLFVTNPESADPGADRWPTT